MYQILSSACMPSTPYQTQGNMHESIHPYEKNTSELARRGNISQFVVKARLFEWSSSASAYDAADSGNP